MTEADAKRPPHELFEERLKNAGWRLLGQGNAGKLNVWSEPGDDEDLCPNIWVPLNPAFGDYDEILRHAAQQLNEWRRKQDNADWDSPAPEGAYAELLTEWKDRKRVHGKYEAAHPTRLREALEEAQAAGLHLAADAIQSLVFEASVQANNQQHLAAQIEELKRENADLRTESDGWFAALNKVEGEITEWAAAELDYTGALEGAPGLPESHPLTQRLRDAEVALRKRAKLEGDA